MNGFERVSNLLDGKPVDRTPVMPITMMFAADYAGIPYGHYVSDYRLLVEAQLRVAEDFGFDQVSCISDPCREAADCGGAIAYYDNQPPAIMEDQALLAEKKTLLGLKPPDPLGGGRMHDRVKGAALFREKVGGSLFIEGWVEGPCAQGADLRGINTLMLDFLEDPAFVEDVFAFALDMEIEFARAQIEAGADVIGVGDAAASLVGPALYEAYIWPYEKRLVDGIKAMGGRVRLHICGDTRHIFEGMGRLGCDIVDLDWMNPLDAARKAMGPDQVLSGNVDPVALLRNQNREAVEQALRRCEAEAAGNYIFAAGCEITRDTAHDNVHAFLACSQENCA